MVDNAWGERVLSSMLWSAWADAVGFISELTDENNLRRRTKGQTLSGPLEWERRVGGKFGVQAVLPAGTYSDDTQLRLATSRAISHRGFDVEAFARVELTVWPSYALGGGRASRAAAAAMARPNATWSTNFFDGWTEAGGNGAAMRIQPHVYASVDPEHRDFVVDVLRNSVVTHGHPRALVGAVLHAIALGHALSRGQIPTPDTWGDLLRLAAISFRSFDADVELSSYWLPNWEATTKKSLQESWFDTIDECARLLTAADEAMQSASGVAEGYRNVVQALALENPASRGSGTATVVAALVLAAALPDDPRAVSLLAASAVGTDTDTIGTMAAAIVGAANPGKNPTPLQDGDYLTAEARRLSTIAAGEPTEAFAYPDLLRWTAPKSQLDCVGLVKGEPALAGLGLLRPLSAPYRLKDAGWSWMESSFGASFLVKHRTVLRELSPENAPPIHRPARTEQSPTREQLSRERNRPQDAVLFSEDVLATAEQKTKKNDAGGTAAAAASGMSGSRIDLAAVLTWLDNNDYEDEKLGYALRRILQVGTADQLAQFLSRIRKGVNGRR